MTIRQLAVGMMAILSLPLVSLGAAAELVAVEGSNHSEPPMGQFEAGDVEIELESGRFGKIISISGSGEVHITIFKRTPQAEVKEQWGKLSPDLVMNLLIEFYIADFFSLRGSYGDEPYAFRVDSLGTVGMIVRTMVGSTRNVLSVKIGDYEKQVKRKQWGPPQLLDLETMVAEYAQLSLGKQTGEH